MPQWNASKGNLAEVGASRLSKQCCDCGLKGTTRVATVAQARERANFEESQKELVDTIDTLARTMAANEEKERC